METRLFENSLHRFLSVFPLIQFSGTKLNPFLENKIIKMLFAHVVEIGRQKKPA